MRLAVVGAGPMCVYALERLAAHLGDERAGRRLRIDVFDRSGEFGPGEVNSDSMSSVGLMNRIAAQLSFAADEASPSAGPLLPVASRPTFLEWLQARRAESGDARYALAPADIPPRWLHGKALRAAFLRHVDLLRARGCEVRLHVAEVEDVVADGPGPMQVAARDVHGALAQVPADRILFVTGNADSFVAPLASDDERRSPEGLRPYPLATQLTPASVPAGARVGIAGFGLTAIDVMLHLTEGRGGRFVPRPGDGARGVRYRYEASGREPGVIVPFSPTGLLPACRPRNAKLADPSLVYRARFFDIPALRRLRASRGRPMRDGAGAGVLQLDFERDVLPVVILEFALAYYATLLGPRFGDEAALAARPRFDAHVDAQAAVAPGRDPASWLLEPVQACFDLTERRLRAQGLEAAAAAGDQAACAFLAVLGPPQASCGGARGLWGHPQALAAHRFDAGRFLRPLGLGAPASGDDWTARWLEAVERDLSDGQQGNLRNPFKVACDGVLRDLRGVFCALLENGGLTPDSHRRFLAGFFRTYQRLSNGAGIDATARVLALAEAGLVDVAVGPDPQVEPAAGHRVCVRGRWTGVERALDLVIDGHLRPFDARACVRPLYRNLLRRGLVRPWVNMGGDAGQSFCPGGLDLSERFHPVRADGLEQPAMTFFGTPAEGARFFQSAAARPQCDSAIFTGLGHWARQLAADLRVVANPSSQTVPT